MSQATLDTYQYGLHRIEQYARDVAREKYWREYDRDAYFCPDCGRDSLPFEVHHIDGNPFNNALSNLVGLCHACHRQRHRRAAIEGKLADMREEAAELGSG